jgi:hypothetical protein
VLSAVGQFKEACPPLRHALSLLDKEEEEEEVQSRAAVMSDKKRREDRAREERYAGLALSPHITSLFCPILGLF